MKNSDTPLVSVGIPTFGRPDGLARTLRYLVNQTYQNLEIIVSDNDTPGPTVDLLMKKFSERDSRIKFYSQPKNLGRIDNFKFVLSKSTGEFFMWAADDDEWDEHFIERCIGRAGVRGSVMSGFNTHFRVSGRRDDNSLPQLDCSKSPFDNASEFLSLMQPSLFYGLHRREEIQFFLHDKIFDFYDCYFVLKMIFDSSFTTTKEILYTAGVDGDGYEIKFASPQQQGNLDYLSFFFAGTRLIIGSKSLDLTQKVLLFVKFINVVLSQIQHHELQVNPSIYLLRCMLKRLIKRLHTKFEAMDLRDNLRGHHIGASDSDKNSADYISYSQSGEDRIISFIFQALQIYNPTYLDIGAHHPSRLSNTFLFYKRGSKGVCVEADPTLHCVFPDVRPRDINLNVGIGDVSSPSEKFYVMSAPTLNTFSREEAERYESLGTHHIEKIIHVPIFTVQEVVEKYFWGQFPNLLSIDVEGLDLQILKSIDFSLYRPQVVCVETITYSENRQETKIQSITEYMENNGYFVYADTYINTIYVDIKSWRMS